MAVIVAVGVNTDGRREVLGMDIGPSEAEPFWTAFLRKLARRGLRGVKLVISDAHEGLKAAIAKVLGATWQRCRVGLLKKPVVAEVYPAAELGPGRMRGFRRAGSQTDRLSALPSRAPQGAERRERRRPAA